MGNLAQLAKRETDFYDRVRAEFKTTPEKLLIDIGEILAVKFSALEEGGYIRGDRNKTALDLIRIEKLQGKRVLDYACGTGEMGVFFALLGAEVHGFDLSGVSVEVANLRGEVNRVKDRIFFQVMSASELRYPDNYFDVCFGHGALHHTIKYPNIGRELSRVMRPGGTAVFCENLGHNWIFSAIRQLIRLKKGTGEVEYLLKYDDYYRVGQYFADTKVYEMGLFFLAKRLFGVQIENRLLRRCLRYLRDVDNFLLHRLPSLKKYCGEAVVQYTK